MREQADFYVSNEPNRHREKKKEALPILTFRETRSLLIRKV